MTNNRNHFCPKCDRKTEQFKQFNLDLDATDEDFVWFCKSCNKTVRKITQKQLKDIFQRKSLDNLIFHIAQYFTIDVADIRSSNKKKTIVLAKHLFSYMAIQLDYGSTREIGRFWGRPHNAVQLGQKVISLKLDKREIRGHVIAISNIIENTDKVLLFKKILRKTPKEDLPKLIDHINNFKTCSNAENLRYRTDS